MTVKEFKEVLARFPEKTPIVLALDPEGNFYKLLDNTTESFVMKTGKYGYMEPVYDEDFEEPVSNQDKNSLVLFPTQNTKGRRSVN